MIRISDLTLRRGTKILLQNASAVIHPGERVGLIGANGAGKSTLFAALRKELSADAGNCDIPVAWRVSYVAQNDDVSQRTAVEYVIDGDTHLRELEAAIEATETLHADHAPGSGELLGELHAQFAAADGYTARSRAESLLLGLGFSMAETTRPLSEFSGGWRMRLNLAKALMQPSDLLLLDEPTNHLDLDAVVWLEQWLKRYPGTMVVVSHDREFLDSVCQVIIHIDQQTLTRYSGNYTGFEIQRGERLRLNQFAYAKQQREIAHLQHFVDRFKAKASKAKQAQSRVKALERMEMITPTHIQSPFTFRFREPDGAPDPMLILDRIDCGYRSDQGTVTVLHDVSLTLRSSERIGLLGANGQGKSTLVKTIAATLAPLSGTIQPGKGLSIGYFAQHQIDTLRLDETPLQQLARIAPRTREQELRDFLGSFDFRGEMTSSLVAPFSGGEKARLALALLIWKKPNLLLLDEPTNHLDLETREALTVALAQFEGTLVLVSHDRALLRATTDQFLLVADGAVAPFDGDLEDYRDWLLGRLKTAAGSRAEPANRPAALPVSQAAPVTQSAKAAAPARPDEAARRERKRDDAQARQSLSQQRRPIETRIQRVEEKLAKLNQRRAEIDAALAEPNAYEEAQREALKQMLVDQAYIAKECAELEAQWLEHHEALDKLAA